MKEIARRANVSVATVSRVLNNHANVRSSVRAHVLAVIDEVGYEPDPIARSLRTRATFTVGFIIRDLVDTVFATMAQGVDDVLREHGYTVLLSTSSGDPERDAHQLALFRSRRADGYILAISDDSSPVLADEVRKTDAPVILLDRELTGAPTDAVLTDYLSGMREAIAYLASLGHRRIAFIGGALNIRPGRTRLQAFTTAMRELGLSPQPDLIRTGSFAQQFGHTMTAELLDSSAPPTALIAAGNQLVVGTLQCLHERRVVLPEDLSLISVDDVDLLRYGTPPVTAIARPFARIGRLAAERLVARMADPTAPERQQILVPTNLIIRESCRSIDS